MVSLLFHTPTLCPVLSAAVVCLRDCHVRLSSAHAPVCDGNLDGLGRDVLGGHPAHRLTACLNQLSLAYPVPSPDKRAAYRRLVLEETLVSLPGLDQTLRPRDARFYPEELLKLGKLAGEDAWRVARAVDLGLGVALLLEKLGHEPVEVRLRVVGLEELELVVRMLRLHKLKGGDVRGVWCPM